MHFHETNKTWLMLSLLALTAFVYFPVTRYPFLSYDDREYVTEVPEVLGGLTWEGLGWSMTTLEAAFWHPVTWWSHMLDVQIFGLDAGGHHATNLLLHLISTMLLFALFRGMTGAVWPSLALAALFALHPLNVESVAWVAERKNVLSTLLGFLTLWAYFRYTRAPGLLRYALVLALFVLGLMAKPMLVTLPALMLLLDYWPLGRLPSLRAWGTHLPALIKEKLPLLIPVLAVSWLAVRAQALSGALPSLEGLPLTARAANALTNYAWYLKKLLWPVDLAVFYPHPGTAWTWTPVLFSTLLLALIFALILWQTQKAPYLLVGWLWYLGTLFPVSGIVQVGGHAMADRYAYLPLIGLFIILAWGLPDLTRGRPLQRTALVSFAILALSLTTFATSRQLTHWRDSISLFEHALQVTERNHIAHSNLGLAFLQEDELDRAIQHLSSAVEIAPDFALAHGNLATALQRRGDLDEAAHAALHALELNPYLAASYNTLGIVQFRKGRVEDSIRLFSEALRVDPRHVPAAYNLALVFENQSRRDESLIALGRVLELDPDHPQARQSMERLLAAKEGENGSDETAP